MKRKYTPNNLKELGERYRKINIRDFGQLLGDVLINYAGAWEKEIKELNENKTMNNQSNNYNKMCKHAKDIWKAWVEGNIVQYKSCFGWVDWDPLSLDKVFQPQNAPSSWRVKPEEVRIKRAFRNYLAKGDDDYYVKAASINPLNIESNTIDKEFIVENSSEFIKWLGDWVESDTTV